MKKIILAVAIASLAISCQKIQAGGNKGVLKMEEGSGRYSDDEMSDEATAKVAEIQNKNAKSSMDSSKVSGIATTPIKKDSSKISEPIGETPKKEMK